MRVITGKYKGRHFDVPRTFKARPTTDFAKENLFNVLNGYIDWDEQPSALDLFAGTGSITLELLSRGCSQVISVEKDPMHYKFIKGIIDYLQDLNAVPVRGDVFKYLSQCRGRFDIIFADPPYVLKEIPELPDMVLERFVSQSPRSLLIAPDWGLKNYEFNHKLLKRMRELNAVQGDCFQ